MAFVIKAEGYNPSGGTFAFHAQKTMYGGKDIATGDMIFVFASENEGGQGLVASGEVTATRPVPKKLGIARQTPRVSFIDPATANLTRRKKPAD
jgi:hypothetical protein